MCKQQGQQDSTQELSLWVSCCMMQEHPSTALFLHTQQSSRRHKAPESPAIDYLKVSWTRCECSWNLFEKRGRGLSDTVETRHAHCFDSSFLNRTIYITTTGVFVLLNNSPLRRCKQPHLWVYIYMY